MMRVGVQTVALLVVASTLGWLLLREVGDAGRDSAAAPSARVARDEASTRDLGAASAPTYLPSDAEGDGEQTASSEVAGADSVHPRARPRSAQAIERRPPMHRTGRFDGRALEEAGYFPHDVEEIRRRWEEAEAEVRVARGPLGPGMPGVTPKDLQREQHEVDSAMRERLGDDDYDAGRFATGQDNRVEIHWIPEGSVAASVGLQEGDLLIEYEGTPIYTPEEYLELMRRDRPLGGREVILTIDRAGKTYEVAVPGGAVGAFRGVRVPPR
jgi:hypothetical protein